MRLCAATDTGYTPRSSHFLVASWKSAFNAKNYIFKQEKKAEDIGINLINMVDVFANLQMDFIFLIQNYSMKEKSMDTSSSICHRFDVDIPRGKLHRLLKGESTWKLWHRFDVEISAWIRLSRSAKYRWALHLGFSMAFLVWEPILSSSGIVMSHCNFSDIDVITDFGTISSGNFAIMQINRNNDKFYFLQNNTNRDSNANIYN